MVIDQIKSVRGKRSIKLKVYQLDYTGGKPHGLFILGGLLEGGEGAKRLIEMGYRLEYEKTTQQNTVGYNLRGEMNKLTKRDLHTTNLIVSW